MNDFLSGDVMIFTPYRRYHLSMKIFVVEYTRLDSFLVMRLSLEGHHLEANMEIGCLSAPHMHWLATVSTRYTCSTLHLTDGTTLSPCTIMYPINAFHGRKQSSCSKFDFGNKCWAYHMRPVVAWCLFESLMWILSWFTTKHAFVRLFWNEVSREYENERSAMVLKTTNRWYSWIFRIGTGVTEPFGRGGRYVAAITICIVK